MVEIADSANSIAHGSKTSARLMCRFALRLLRRGGSQANRIMPNAVSEAWRAECVIGFALIEGVWGRGAVSAASMPDRCQRRVLSAANKQFIDSVHQRSLRMLPAKLKERFLQHSGVDAAGYVVGPL